MVDRRKFLTVLSARSASSYANGETAPSGFHWEFVIDDLTGSRVTDDPTNQPIVSPVAN
jgi:hypothetical protein